MTCGGGEEFFVCEADQFTNGLMVECIFTLDFPWCQVVHAKHQGCFVLNLCLIVSVFPNVDKLNVNML